MTRGHALCAFPGATAGFDADAADLMAKVEGFRKDLQLLVTPVVIEILLPFFDGSDRTNTEAITAGSAIFHDWGIDHERKIRKDGDQPKV